MENEHSFNEHSSKWEYKEGDKSLDGSIITHILGREQDFIIFRCADGPIGWEHVSVPEWAYPALNEYENAGSKLRTYLGGFHKDEIRTCMAICLLNTFRLKDEGTVEAGITEFEPVRELIRKLEKREILYTHSNFYIYLNQNQIDVVCTEQQTNIDASKIQASHLYIQAKHSLNKKQLDHATKLIASDIAEHYGVTNKTPFEVSKNYIELTTKQNIKITYLELSTFFAFIYSLISFTLYKTTSLHDTIYGKLLLCSIAGVIGSIVSILQRNQTIDVEPFSSKWLLSFQGLTRLILGMIFGCAVLIAAKANIALGLASSNIYAISILAFVSGLNERFIPDLLEKNLKQL